MTYTNSKMAVEAKGWTNPIDFTTPSGDPNKVLALRNVIAYEGVDSAVIRGPLDEMSPSCRTMLYVMLTALSGAVT